MPVKITCPCLEACPSVARKILMTFPTRRIFAFDGKLGSGKTTMIKALCHELGVKEVTSSPSFAILNEYLNGQGDALYHFDFYRIQDIREVYDLGYEEYFFSGNYCFIEWAEKVRELLPEDSVYIRTEDTGDENSRSFIFDPDQ